MARMHDAQSESPDRTASPAGGGGGPVRTGADSERAGRAGADGEAAGRTGAEGARADGAAAASAGSDGAAAESDASDGARAESAGADGTQAEVTGADELPGERPKSAYQLPTKQNTVLRNIVWAIVLTMVVVIVLAVGFFGVGSDLEREPLENSEVDVAATAERAQDVADFPVAVPATGEDWQVRSARFTDGQSPRWTVQYTAPGGDLATLAEDTEVSASLLSAEMPGATVTEQTSLRGAECQVLGGGDDAEQTGIACQGEGFGILVHGAADQAELEQLMDEALAAIG